MRLPTGSEPGGAALVDKSEPADHLLRPRDHPAVTRAVGQLVGSLSGEHRHEARPEGGRKEGRMVRADHWSTAVQVTSMNHGAPDTPGSLATVLGSRCCTPAEPVRSHQLPSLEVITVTSGRSDRESHTSPSPATTP